jgi:hypothetical protein
VVRVDGPCPAEQHTQPGRVDEADGGQVEERRHSVRSCRVERRAEALGGTPVEFAAGSYETCLGERLDRDSEKSKRTHRTLQLVFIETSAFPSGFQASGDRD